MDGCQERTRRTTLVGKYRVVVADAKFSDYRIEREILVAAGASLEVLRLPNDKDLIAVASDADALLVHAIKVGADAIESLQRCRGIVRYGVGYDVIDTEAARARGIPVSNVPDYCTTEVADHTLAMILTLSRRLQRVDAQLRAGRWEGAPCRPIHASASRTLGLLGIGRIGAAVVARAKPFGFRIIAHDPHAAPESFAHLGVEPVTRESLLAESDFITLHLPLTPATWHTIDDAAIAAMKPGTSLVNVSRGGLVDEEALARALHRGHLAGAALDVFEREPLPADSPLRTAPGALLTSHCAWYSEEAFSELQRLAAEEVVRYLRREPGKNTVNR